MNDAQIILPSNFSAPRYMGGLWLDCRRRWTDEDLTLLVAACDMKLRPSIAANTLGRSPQILAHKAQELRLVTPKEWRELLYTRKKRLPKVDLQYPFIVKPDDRHADLIAVNRLVSRQLPGREDVIQDVMLALWESRTSLDDLKNDPRALRSFVKAFRKTCYERGGHAESMDVTLHSDSGDGKSKYEDARYQRTLANEDDKFIEDHLFGSRVSHDSDVLDAIDAEEQVLGVPAALWMRAGLQ